jgi:hypothetical protein
VLRYVGWVGPRAALQEAAAYRSPPAHCRAQNAPLGSRPPNQVISAAAGPPPSNHIGATASHRDGWVFGGADTDAPKEFAAHKGQSLKVLDKAGNFYAVYDSTAGKTGWVPVADVKPRFNKWDWDFDDPSIGSKNYISPSSDKMSSGNASNNASSDNNSYLFKKITDAAVQFRESYRNNQYIQVTGFTVKLGIPPALDLAFGFK